MDGEPLFIRREFILDADAVPRSHAAKDSTNGGHDDSAKHLWATAHAETTFDMVDKSSGSQYLLVVGAAEYLPPLHYLRGIAAAAGLDVCIFAHWEEWRISVYPSEFRFTMSHIRTAVTIGRSDVGSVLYFGDPQLPSGTAADWQYVSLEFSALLMALLALCGWQAFRRLESIYSGWSDEPVRRTEFSTHFKMSIWPKDGREGFFWRDGAAFLTGPPGGESEVETNALQGPHNHLVICCGRNTMTPYRGIVPPWIIGSSTRISPFEAGDRNQPSALSILPEDVKETAANATRLLILAHRKDPVAGGLWRAVRRLHFDCDLVDLSAINQPEVMAAALRYMRKSPLVFARPELPSQHPHTRMLQFTLLRSLEEIGGAVFNRPSRGASNFSKPLHLLQLSLLGWTIPQSIVTNDEFAAREFAREWPKAIYKSCSAIRSTVQEFNPEDDDRLSHLRRCPVLFQRHIGGIDCRVHIVREHALPSFISSDAVDYRAGSHTIRRSTISHDVTQRCIATAARLGFNLAGIDLKIDQRENRVVAFECNCMPAFTHFGPSVTHAVAEALIGSVSKTFKPADHFS